MFEKMQEGKLKLSPLPLFLFRYLSHSLSLYLSIYLFLSFFLYIFLSFFLYLFLSFFLFLSLIISFSFLSLLQRPSVIFGC